MLEEGILNVPLRQARTDEERKAVERRLKKREALKKRKLKEAGIDYDFGPASYVSLNKFLLENFD